MGPPIQTVTEGLLFELQPAKSCKVASGQDDVQPPLKARRKARAIVQSEEEKRDMGRERKRLKREKDKDLSKQVEELSTTNAVLAVQALLAASFQQENEKLQQD
jgi:hypothetical protein